MKLPNFPDTRMIGLTACGDLVSPSRDLSKTLQKLHERRPFAKYRAKQGTVYAHIMGGKLSAANHIHVDLYKSEMLEIDKVPKPKGNSTRESMSDDLNAFIGAKVRVKYRGFFLIDRSELATSEGLAYPFQSDKDNRSSRSIEMTSATYEMVGFPIRRLIWGVVSRDRVRIELVYSEELTISDVYLTTPLETFSKYFDLFVFGK